MNEPRRPDLIYDLIPAKIRHRIARFVIRTLRIGAGLALGFLAWVWPLHEAVQITDRPIGGLSISEIAAMILWGAIGLWALKWAFEIAFGPAPPPQPAAPR